MEGKPLDSFDFGGEWGTLVVERSCPKCGRFINSGKVGLTMNRNNNVDFVYSGWKCKKHGEVEPYNLGWF